MTPPEVRRIAALGDWYKLSPAKLTEALESLTPSDFFDGTYSFADVEKLVNSNILARVYTAAQTEALQRRLDELNKAIQKPTPRKGRRRKLPNSQN